METGRGLVRKQEEVQENALLSSKGSRELKAEVANKLKCNKGFQYRSSSICFQCCGEEMKMSLTALKKAILII